MLSKQESSCWKSLLPEVNNLALAQLKHLQEGLNLYNSSHSQSNSFNGKIVGSFGSSALYEYPSEASDKIILFIPSLINKPAILDLSKEQSLLLRFKNSNIKPYLFDWGEPKEEEFDFSIEDYISKRLLKVIDYIYHKERKPIILAGYCMGGLFALASYFHRKSYLAGLVSIATPWDFNVTNFPRINYSRLFDTLNTDAKTISADFIRMLFYLPNWSTINQKFINLSKGKYDHHEFMKIEHWVNDGVNITKNVMRECLLNIADKNLTLKRQWKILDQVVDPTRINLPTLSFLAKNDNIVPMNCALPLTTELSNNHTIEAPSGHIGMIINKKYNLAQEIINWSNTNLLINEN